jgi:RNA-directed DNA polymerase
VFEVETMPVAQRQKPARAGRPVVGQGEALDDASSDEAAGPRHAGTNTGPGLLDAVLARENLRRAWKRVRSNKGAAGADGLDVDQTGAYLRLSWPRIREEVL